MMVKVLLFNNSFLLYVNLFNKVKKLNRRDAEAQSFILFAAPAAL